MLAFRGEVLSLESVPDVAGLVAGFSKRQLAFFCRVLALLVELGAALAQAASHWRCILRLLHFLVRFRSLAAEPAARDRKFLTRNFRSTRT